MPNQRCSRSKHLSAGRGAPDSSYPYFCAGAEPGMLSRGRRLGWVLGAAASLAETFRATSVAAAPCPPRTQGLCLLQLAGEDRGVPSGNREARVQVRWKHLQAEGTSSHRGVRLFLFSFFPLFLSCLCPPPSSSPLLPRRQRGRGGERGGGREKG